MAGYRSTRCRRVACVLCGVLALAGCASASGGPVAGSSSPTVGEHSTVTLATPQASVILPSATTAQGNTGATPSNPCGLVTPTQVGTVIGEQVSLAPAQPPDVPGTQECEYDAAATGDKVTITYALTNAQSFYASDKAQQSTSSDTGVLQHVAGLGTDAFWNGKELDVLSGNAAVVIKVETGQLAEGSAQLLASERQLATIVLGHV